MNEEHSRNLQLSDSLIETIKNSELSKNIGDLLEVGIDSFLKDGILKEIPGISILNGFGKLELQLEIIDF